MKTKKAIKRLAKIEALMLGVTKRYSASTSHIREALQDAQAAIARAKEAVSLQASSGTATSPPGQRQIPEVKHSEPPSIATPEPPKPRRRISEEGMQRIIAATKRRWALQRAEAAQAQGAAKKAAASKPAPKKATMKAPAKTAVKSPVKTAKKTAAKKQQKKAAKVPAAAAPTVAQ